MEATAEALTQEEVLRRCRRRAARLAGVYRWLYWAMAEEVRARHQQYVWDLAWSPLEAEQPSAPPGGPVPAAVGEPPKPAPVPRRCARDTDSTSGISPGAHWRQSSRRRLLEVPSRRRSGSHRSRHRCRGGRNAGSQGARCGTRVAGWPFGIAVRAPVNRSTLVLPFPPHQYQHL
jgi:hypothetical protein